MAKRKRKSKLTALIAALLTVTCFAIIAGMALSGGDDKAPPAEEKTIETATVSEAATVSESTITEATEAEIIIVPNITYCKLTLYNGSGEAVTSKTISAPNALLLIEELDKNASEAIAYSSPYTLSDIIKSNNGRAEIVFAYGDTTRVALVYQNENEKRYWQEGKRRVEISDANFTAIVEMAQ